MSGLRSRATVAVGYRCSEVGLVSSEASSDIVIAVPAGPAILQPRTVNFQSLGPIVPGLAPVSVDRKDINSQVEGLKKRMGRVLPNSDSRLLAELKAFVKRETDKLEPIREVPDFEEWIEGCPYTQARKSELRVCWDALKGGVPTKQQRQKIVSFVKAEYYGEYKHARWINSRSDSFKAWSGPWFKKIEAAVFARPEFIKHVPVPDRPAKLAGLRSPGARYVATDFTAYESHFTPALMDAVELVLYRRMLKHYPAVSDLICSTIAGTNKGRTREGVSFVVKGRRMSGDMCTSLGNGFTNLMLWAFLCEKNEASWQGFVEGDDGIFSVTSGAIPTSDQYAQLGMTIKMEVHEDPTTASFCGIVCSEDQQIIRDPSVFLAGFGWSQSCLGCGAKVRKQLLRAKALSAVYETPHCPVLGVMARRSLELTRGADPRYAAEYLQYRTPPPAELKVPKFEPTFGTRVLFERLYGITVLQQLQLEADIRAGSSLDRLGLALMSAGNGDFVHYESRFVERGPDG